MMLMGRLSQPLNAYIRAREKLEIARPSYLQISLWILLLVVTILTSLYDYDSFQTGVYNDDSSYAVLAESLAFSDNYGLVNVPGDPLPTRFPFGYPLLLTPIARLSLGNLDALKLESLAMVVISASLLFWGWPYLSQRKSYWYGLTIATISTLSPMVIGHTRVIMSEPSYAVFMLISLILLERYLTSEVKNKRWYSVIFGITLTLSVFIRMIGIVLCFVVLLRLFFVHKGRRLAYDIAGIIAGALILIAAVLIFTPIKLHDLVPYEYLLQFDNPVDWYADTLERSIIPRMADNLSFYVGGGIRQTVVPIGGGHAELQFGQRFNIPNLPLVTSLLITGLVSIGLFSFFGQKGFLPSIFIFQILYFVIVLAWPWRGPRFLYAIQPFLIFDFLMGCQLLARPLDRYRPKISQSLFALSAFVLFMISIYSVSPISSHESSTQYTRDFYVGTIWLRENAPSNAVVMAQHPQTIYLYTRLKTVDYSNTITTISDLIRLCQMQGIDYILVAPLLQWREDGQLFYDEYTTEQFIPLLQELVSQERLVLVYESTEDLVQIYQIVQESAG